MAWSEYDNHGLSQDLLDKREHETLDRYVKELDYRYKDNHGRIESEVDDIYSCPEEAPDLPPAMLGQFVGRKLKDRVPKVREFYTEFNGTDNINDSDKRRTLEYIGIKSLRNGSSA